MKAATAAMLLLALVVAAAATVVPSSSDGSTTTVANTAGRGNNHHQHHRSSSHLMAGLTECVTICGSGVTNCMLGCYPPLVDLDPVELPVCLLKCTNDAMVCATSCPITGNT